MTHRPVAMAGTPGAAVIAELAPCRSDLIVPKRYHAAFTQTDLDATCRVHGVDRLVVTGQHTRVHGVDRPVVTGQHTDCCCRHTSYDAFARGITVVAVSDATAVYEPFAAGRYQQAQDQALRYLRTYYGAEITSTADLL